ncbi:hypothetical protein [uncultured Corynebacterium sp.]|uniref:hypothetical protein n=1 Tax=uncultured Corynebacterium sp. TaxID=159447 RepID=UPI0025E1A925|nr:hypothetical protein [uncultured Corynebacterium sp.]
MRTPSVSLAVPAALLCAALTLTACSGSSDSEGSSGAVPSTVVVTEYATDTAAPATGDGAGAAASSSAKAAGATDVTDAAGATGDKDAENTKGTEGAGSGESGANKVIAVEDLETLWVPELCGNPAGNLVGGELPGAQGQAFLDRREDGTPMGAYTDINGDGKDEAVISYYCDQGGVSWPDNLLIYDNDLNYLTQVEWDAWSFESPEGTVTPGRNSVRNLRWDDSTVTVTWLGALPTDAACCSSQLVDSTLTMSGGQPVMEVASVGRA